MMRSVLFTALLALSASATAQDLDYDYFFVGFSQVEIDDDAFGGSVDGNVLGAGGSYSLTENFLLFGSYQTGELEDNSGDDADVTVYDIGFGYHMPLSDTIDIVGKLSYEYLELEDQGASIDDNGLGLEVGLRSQINDSFEVHGAIQYVDWGTVGEVLGDKTTFGLGTQFTVSDSIEIGLDGTWGDDVSQYTLNGRFYFGD